VITLPPKFVAFDLETTGLVNTKDEIVEIGAVKFTIAVEKGKVVPKLISEFNMLVNPNMMMPEEASKVNHITDDMLSGFIGEDGKYYATAPAGISSFEIAKQTGSSYNYSKNPVTWNVSARLTKEFGKFAGLSFYANNVMFYEPFLTQSNSSSLTQRNTGTFSFGVELFLNL
jgi:hypothetical protein